MGPPISRIKKPQAEPFIRAKNVTPLDSLAGHTRAHLDGTPKDSMIFGVKISGSMCVNCFLGGFLLGWFHVQHPKHVEIHLQVQRFNTKEPRKKNTTKKNLYTFHDSSWLFNRDASFMVHENDPLITGQYFIPYHLPNKQLFNQLQFSIAHATRIAREIYSPGTLRRSADFLTDHILPKAAIALNPVQLGPIFRELYS